MKKGVFIGKVKLYLVLYPLLSLPELFGVGQ